MSTLAEKRVHADAAGRDRLYVACGAGVAAVAVSDDLVGEFGLARRCDARDLAAAGGRLAVATGGDVLLAADGLEAGEPAFRATGFGPAVAVGWCDGALLAAGPDGRVARAPVGAATDTGEWTALGTAPVTAIDGPLVGAEDGLYAFDGDLAPAGLDGRAVRDVTAALPHAAAEDGLYALDGAPERVRTGAFEAVASVGERAAGGERLPPWAHAAARDALLARDPARGEWVDAAVPAGEPVAAVAYPPSATVAVTRAGTVLADAGDGWRSRALGLPDVRAAVAP